MSNGSDGLHLYGCLGLKGTIEKSRGIDCLEAEVLEVEVSHVERLCGESVWCNFDIGPGDGLQETGLSDVGESTKKQSTCVRVDRGQTTQMLSDLVKVGETVLETLEERSHTSKRGLLQLLALEERLGICWFLLALVRGGQGDPWRN